MTTSPTALEASPDESEPDFRRAACQPVRRRWNFSAARADVAARGDTAFTDMTGGTLVSDGRRKTLSSDCPMKALFRRDGRTTHAHTAHIGPGIADAWRDGLDLVPTAIMEGHHGSVKAKKHRRE